MKGTKLGYIALTDASPLIIAKEKGFFAKYGLPDMEMLKQASWGATRDNMALGTKANGIDGGHILRPKVHLYSTGKVMQNKQPLPMYTLLNLNEDCQAISVSNEYKDLNVELDASPLKAAFAKKKAAGKEVKVAMTFPGGTHDLWIRYWLAAGGIDPDKDVSTIVVPPPQMVANMKVGNMDAFCVGEPWNEQLVNQDIGFTALTTGELWFKHPEKILGMRADWVDANPKATQAILMAVMEAQQWCEKMENKQEMAEIVGRRQWFNVPVADIIGRIKGDINYGHGRTVEGHQSPDEVLGRERRGLLSLEEPRHAGSSPRTSAGASSSRHSTSRRWSTRPTASDLWLEAAKALGVAGPPAGDIRGVEKFFDGKVFDPAEPAGLPRRARDQARRSLSDRTPGLPRCGSPRSREKRR